MRSKITTALEVAGLVAISVGAFLFSAAIGFVVTGVFAVGLGYLWGDGE